MNNPDYLTISTQELQQRAGGRLVVVPTLDDLMTHFARSIMDEIRANNAAGHPTRLIIPVGPVGQYPLLVRWCNQEGLSWRNVHAFAMDEYLDWQGRPLPPDHPLSFGRFLKQDVFAHFDAAIRIPDEQLHLPDPLNLDAGSRAMAAIGGIDTCYGGIGYHGHIAFNEPAISRWYTISPQEFKASLTRIITLAPETVVMNSIRATGGNPAALPPMAVTLGMKDILGARRIRLYCQGGMWQRTVLRTALLGPVSVAWPASFIQEHADAVIITDENTATPPTAGIAA